MCYSNMYRYAVPNLTHCEKIKCKCPLKGIKAFQRFWRKNITKVVINQSVTQCLLTFLEKRGLLEMYRSKKKITKNNKGYAAYNDINLKK